MFIRIQPESQKPIYTQLIYQIKRGILKKELLPGEGLPSVRSLAGDIGINMHTVNKAYKLLVEEGVLVQQKKGFMVNPTMKIKMQEKELALYRERLEELIIDTHIFSISEEEIEKMRESIEKMLKESEQI
ncbi:GntR family transcriptional regulator [Carnobacterium maltaromaticum]|uniref:GntR family transcriptional regulator n=1 Tax=Carnobacterium maltaromaticum TaxID=2751 RepID=UPI000C7831BC|nr:GntR family transcriptional regulator [Carnobacterium maltaromaticum]PLS34651.1 GntR family transcriptional regulator [Carnobacterium maltaromaticum]PLS36469.1 GntR family transcriptional regulator [Carnobacterium maltaromaticum]PLS37284.1 GntR family transcriptional regulator [Carnobacterium maltaromaticum]PLS43500.1 GntR family transcriptional regulator [Carnobacterium maltaromaticum]PLS43845.1 GntR family transcriptional regulator [Carnobacterium maltaromaticum]